MASVAYLRTHFLLLLLLLLLLLSGIKLNRMCRTFTAQLPYQTECP